VVVNRYDGGKPAYLAIAQPVDGLAQNPHFPFHSYQQKRRHSYGKRVLDK